MDRENFDAIIARYLEKFDYTNGKGPEEWFKWDAIACFQQNWDLDAPDFPTMFANSVKQFSVLIDNAQASPINGLKTLVNQPGEAEIVREAFRALYADDGGDIALRQKKAEAFVQTVNERIEKLWPGSHKYPQSMRSAIIFLTMRYPAENYILFWSRADTWARYTEFADDFSSGSSFSLPIFYRMCDEVRDEIEKDPRLRQCNDKRMAAARVNIEDNYHTLVYDLIYCATCYNLYVDIPTYEKSSARRIERSKERKNLETLNQEMLAAEKSLSEFSLAGCLPPDLTGHTVRSKAFGEGRIVSQSETQIGVQFENEFKQFIYPDVFVKKYLSLVMTGDLESVKDSLENAKTRKALEKAASDARIVYESAASKFRKKWKKSIHNDAVITDDE